MVLLIEVVEFFFNIMEVCWVVGLIWELMVLDSVLADMEASETVRDESTVDSVLFGV